MGVEAISTNVNCSSKMELSRLTLYFFCRSLSPVNAVAILKEIEKDGDMKITDLYPEDFKLLFETIESFRESCRWLFDDCIEDIIL